MTALLAVLATATAVTIIGLSYLVLRVMGTGALAHYDVLNGKGGDLR